MPLLPNQVEALRKPFKGSFYMAILKPDSLWKARVNGAHDKGATTITFDTGSSVDSNLFSAVRSYQEVYIGTSLGADDIGHVRLRSITSVDGTSGTMLVSANSIIWTDNMYITFMHDYKIRPKFSLIGDDGTFYKDTDVIYSDFNTKPSPICIAGTHTAGFLNPTFIINSQLSDSYSMLAGVTFTNYSASVYPTTGVTISINSSTGIGTITFAQVGTYWVTYSVTDSNGKITETFRSYQVFSESVQPLTMTSFYIDSYKDALSINSKTVQVTLHDEMSTVDIPHDSLAIIWCEPEIILPSLYTLNANPNYFVMVGYTRKCIYSSQFDKGTASNQIEIISPDQVATDIYSFSMVLRAIPDAPDVWWKYDNELTPTKAVQHFMYLHSTIMQLCDVLGLTNNNELVAIVELESGQKGTVLQMSSEYLSSRSIRQYLSCDVAGRIILLPHKQLMIDSDRNSLPAYMTIEDEDMAVDITIVNVPTDNTVLAHVSGMQFTGTFEDSGLPIVNPICAIAPNRTPLDRGSVVADMNYQVLSSQSQANQLAGRVMAAANNPIPEINITFRGGYLFNLDTSNRYIYLFTHTTDDGQVFTERRIFLKSVSSQINVNNATIVTNAIFEVDSPGITGETTNCPQFPDLDGDYEEEDPDSGSGALITGGFNGVYRLGLQSSLWTQTTSEQTYTMHLDTFWKDTQQSESSNDAILWRGGLGYIKRTDDGGITWSDITIPDPPNSYGDSPAPTTANTYNYYSSTSQLVQGTHAFLRSFTNDVTRTWLAVTLDDGVTWEQEPVCTSGEAGDEFNFLIDTDAQYSEGVYGSYLGIQIQNAVELQSGIVLIAYTVNIPSYTELRLGIIQVFHNTAILKFYEVVTIGVTDFALAKRDNNSAVLIYRDNDVSPAATARMITIYNDHIQLHDPIVLADVVPHEFTGRFSAAFLASNKIVTAYAMGGASDLGIGITTLGIDTSNNLTVNNFTLLDDTNSVGFVNIINTGPQRATIVYQFGGFSPVGLAYITIYNETLSVVEDIGLSNNRICSCKASNDGSLIAVAYTTNADTDVHVMVTNSLLAAYNDIVVFTPDVSETVNEFQMIYESTGRIVLSIAVDDGSGNVNVYIIPIYIPGNFLESSGIQYIVPMLDAGHSLCANNLSGGRLMFAYSYDSSPHNFIGHVIDLYGQGTEATNLACSLSEDNIVHVMVRYGGVWGCQTWDILSPLTMIDNIRVGQYINGYNLFVAASIENQCYWVFGRCVEGHILFVDENLQTITAVVDNWSSGFCTNLLDLDDKIVAIYSNGTNNKIYVNSDGEFRLISTLTTKKSAFPLGIAYDWINKRICVVAQTNSNPTVIYTPPNYLNSHNITLNHPQSGARVIEVL